GAPADHRGGRHWCPRGRRSWPARCSWATPSSATSQAFPASAAEMVRIRVIGPTSLEWAAVADDVAADLQRVARPGVMLDYRCTGTGPTAVRSAADAVAAAPGVVA